MDRLSGPRQLCCAWPWRSWGEKPRPRLRQVKMVSPNPAGVSPRSYFFVGKHGLPQGIVAVFLSTRWIMWDKMQSIAEIVNRDPTSDTLQPVPAIESAHIASPMCQRPRESGRRELAISIWSDPSRTSRQRATEEPSGCDFGIGHRQGLDGCHWPGSIERSVRQRWSFEICSKYVSTTFNNIMDP